MRGQSEIPGAKIDVENWRRFLRSELGGAWSDSEIHTLSEPRGIEVASALVATPDTYLLVAFSGHGCDGSVVLNEAEQDFPVSNLRPRTSKGTLVVDACRGTAEAQRMAFGTIATANVQLQRAQNESVVLRNAQAGRATEFRDRLMLERTTAVSVPIERTYWDNIAGNCSPGIVEMLACSKGQAAGESPALGGFYTLLLLEAADVWGRIQASTGFQSTKDAHAYAAKKMPPQQTPEYLPPHLAFPFAVKFKR